MRQVVKQKLVAVAVLAIALAGCSSTDDTPSAEPSTTQTTSSVATTSTSAEATTTTAQSEAEATEPTTQDMTPEADFLDALPAAGIPFKNNESAFGTGQRICKALAAGESDDAAAKVGIEEQGWNTEQAKKAVELAKKGMCEDR